MAEPTTTPPKEESQGAPPAPQQEGKPSGEAQGPRQGVLSPDFLVVALPFALLIDVLDFVFEVGTLVSLVLGAPLILWMMWREKNIGAAREAVEQATQSQQKRQAAKSAARQTARRGGRRVLRRALLIYVAEAIPIVNLVPFWLIGTVRTAQRT